MSIFFKTTDLPPTSSPLLRYFFFLLPASLFFLFFCFVCDNAELKFLYQGLIEKNEARMEKRLIATLPVGDKVLHIFLSCPNLSTP